MTLSTTGAFLFGERFGGFVRSVATGAIDQRLLQSSISNEANDRVQTFPEEWQQFSDGVLLELARAAGGHVDEDDLLPPTTDVVTSAFKLVDGIKKQGATLPPPRRILSTGRGGIAFEWLIGDTLLVATLRPDHLMDFATFRDNRLIDRDVSPLTF